MRAGSFIFVLAALVLACRKGGDRGPSHAAAPATPAGAEYADWYPEDIAPPPGTQYPCALTALPRDLPGIPAADRRFINHVYSSILRATQAKLVLLKDLEGEGDHQPALQVYLKKTSEAQTRITEEPIPPGLETFVSDVLQALVKQQAFFIAAARSRAEGARMAEVYRHPEGRSASAHLISAWARMQQQYPRWSAEVKDSVYHHLCALDLF